MNTYIVKEIRTLHVKAESKDDAVIRVGVAYDHDQQEYDRMWQHTDFKVAGLVQPEKS